MRENGKEINCIFEGKKKTLLLKLKPNFKKKNEKIRLIPQIWPSSHLTAMDNT
jgi:hypothetical protein